MSTSNTRELRPSPSYFWMYITSSLKFLCCMLMCVVGFVLATWDKVGEAQDPLVQFLSKPGMSYWTWGGFVVACIVSAIYLGIEYWKFSRIKYILTKTGIVFGEGIDYTEDLIAWQIINDVDLTRSIPEQLLGLGTLWVSADGGIHRPMLYIKNYKEERERLNLVIRSNYKRARRVVS